MVEPPKKNPLGPTGRVVADNIRRLRGDMQYVKLAAILDSLGRPIPTLGLRKIEGYERRVDADDLIALAVALEVSPMSLLMPYAESADDEVQITGWAAAMNAQDVWQWMQMGSGYGAGSSTPPMSLEKGLPPFAYRDLWKEKAELKALFEQRQRKYGLSDGDD